MACTTVQETIRHIRFDCGCSPLNEADASGGVRRKGSSLALDDRLRFPRVELIHRLQRNNGMSPSTEVVHPLNGQVQSYDLCGVNLMSNKLRRGSKMAFIDSNRDGYCLRIYGAKQCIMKH